MEYLKLFEQLLNITLFFKKNSGQGNNMEIFIHYKFIIIALWLIKSKVINQEISTYKQQASNWTCQIFL